MTDFIDARKLLIILLSRWKMLVFFTILAGLVGYFYSSQQSPVYESTATLAVSRTMLGTDLDPDDFDINDELTLLYADIARRQPVLQATIDALELPMTWQALRRQIRAEPAPNTDFVEISAEAKSPDVASAIANEVTQQLIAQSPAMGASEQEELNRAFALERADAIHANIRAAQARLHAAEQALANALQQPGVQVGKFQEEVRELENLIADLDSTYSRLLLALNAGQITNSLSVFQPAQPNFSPVRPQVPMLTLLAVIVGVVLGLGVVFLLEFMNVIFRSADEAANVLQLPDLGTIGQIRHTGESPQDALLLGQPYQSPVTEEYRLLFSKLDFIYRSKERRIVLVTSASPSDGKSLTVANLAIIMAQAGYRTIVLDANLRRPMQHILFNLRDTGGLTELLNTPHVSFDRMLKKTRVDNLSVVTCGDLRLARPEQLSSQRAKELIWELYNLADVVLIDSTEAIGVADVILMAHLADDVIFVIGEGNTSRADATEAIHNLRQAGAHLLGFIWNATRLKRKSRNLFWSKVRHPVTTSVNESASVKP